MEVLGTEFCDMSPQELAAPVNTIAVSLEEIKTNFHTTSTEKLTLTWWLAAQRNITAIGDGFMWRGI